MTDSTAIDLLLRAAVSEEVAEENEFKYFESLEKAPVQFDKRFERRKRKIIEKYERTLPKSHVRIVINRVILTCLIICTLLFAIIISVTAVRSTLLQMVIDWHDKYFTVHFEPDDTEAGEDSYQISAPDKIEVIKRPTAIDPSWEEEITVNTKSVFESEYYLNNGFILSFGQYLLSAKMQVDAEATFKEIYINGHKAILSIDDLSSSTINILWNDNEYYYFINTWTLTEEQLIRIAESVE